MIETVFSEPVWAIVELFGRNVIAGEVSEVDVAGTQMLRVDVPAIDGMGPFTKFFGGTAIYAITPTDELSAMHAARTLRMRPVDKWTIPDRQLQAPQDMLFDEPD